jgi:glycosyltransferase involved in cell wall biosynthesis
MRILFIAPSYYPHIGDVEYVVKSVAERLAKAGHEVTVVAGEPNTDKSYEEVVNGVRVVEAYLHLVNPWLLPIATTLLIHQALRGSIIAIAVLATGALLLAYKPYRTWVATQLYLIVAMLRNIWSKEIAWRKQAKW